MKWAQSISQPFGGVIAIDGKTLCNSRGCNKDSIHIVSTFAAENSLILGQLKCAGKGKEIETIQILLDILDVKGSTVTIDAAGCQKAIVEKIRKKRGDYLVALKGNQGLLHDEVTNFFEQAVKVKPEEANCDYWCSEEKARGRQEKREVWTTGNIDWLPQLTDWCDCKALYVFDLRKQKRVKQHAKIDILSQAFYRTQKSRGKG